MSEKIVLERLTMSPSRATLKISTLEKPLEIDPDTVYRYRLVKGVVLTDAQLRQLMAESALIHCRRDATRLLAGRQHSIGELTAKLRRRKHDRETVDTVIRELKKQRLLDDGNYAQVLAERVFRRRPCGRAYLLAQLESKRIDRDLAAEAVDAVLRGADETEAAVRALKQRWREFSQFELETARRKAYNYLSRRGFTFNAAKAAFEYVTDTSKSGGSN